MRARNIKPGFFENEQLAQLPFEARLLFAGLWLYADREGRFEWRPQRIKALIFPYDDMPSNVITCHLMSLHAMTLILQYKNGNGLYGYIPNFLKHQRPHPHEARSTLPDPTAPESELVPIPQQIQCHDMSLNVMKCKSDSLIPFPPPTPPRGKKTPQTPQGGDSGETLPPWMPSETWKAFKEHRRMLKSPMSQKAEQLILRKLQAFMDAGQNPEEIINQSIEHGWKGVFPLNGDTTGKIQATKLTRQGQKNLAAVQAMIAKEVSHDGR